MSILVLVVAVGIAYIERSSIAHIVPYLRREGLYESAEIGYILSAFGWGYVLGLPFSGYIITRLGHRRTLLILALAWTVSTAWFASATNLTSLAMARFALGLAEAPLFPLFVSWVSATSSRSESSARIGVIEGASYLGLALSGPLTVWLADAFNWRIAYGSVGALGLLVAAISPFLSNPNLVLTDGDRTFDGRPSESETPHRISFVVFISCSTGFLLYNFAKSFHSTWLPSILVESFGFTSSQAAWLTFAQSLAAPVMSILVGFVSASLLARGLGLSAARLMPMTVGFGAGAVITVAPYLSNGLEAIFILSFVGIISTSALIWSVPGDLSSRTSTVAHVSGYLNAIANLGTIASPIAVGYVIASPAGHKSALALLGAASLLALLSFYIGYFVLSSLRARQ